MTVPTFYSRPADHNGNSDKMQLPPWLQRDQDAHSPPHQQSHHSPQNHHQGEDSPHSPQNHHGGDGDSHSRPTSNTSSSQGKPVVIYYTLIQFWNLDPGHSTHVLTPRSTKYGQPFNTRAQSTSVLVSLRRTVHINGQPRLSKENYLNDQET